MKWHVSVPVEATDGTQTYEAEADTQEEAIAICKNGNGKYIRSDIEVLDLNWDPKGVFVEEAPEESDVQT